MKIKIPAIDLKEPIDNYQKSLAMSYDNIVEKVINVHLFNSGNYKTCMI